MYANVSNKKDYNKATLNLDNKMFIYEIYLQINSLNSMDEEKNNSARPHYLIILHIVFLFIEIDYDNSPNSQKLRGGLIMYLNYATQIFY